MSEAELPRVREDCVRKGGGTVGGQLHTPEYLEQGLPVTALCGRGKFVREAGDLQAFLDRHSVIVECGTGPRCGERLALCGEDVELLG